MPQFQQFPLPFWLVLAAIALFAAISWRQRESAIRIPMLMVIFTVTIWYVGDALYNDYTGYQAEIGDFYLVCAWWEVLLFICAFGILAPLVHRYFNRKLLGRPSNMLSLVVYGGLQKEKFQNQLDLICWFLLVVWTAMMTVALYRTDYDFQGLFMPYLGEKVNPWERGRLGAGYDSVLAAAGYFQIALTAAFGVIAALACRPVTFGVATIVYLLTMPGYIFDRTRSVMLATLLPGFLALVFLRIRAGIIVRVVILAVGFLAIEGWLKFVIETRSEMSIASAFSQGINFQEGSAEDVKHLGLNMFEELGFINTFLANGTYHPNWGARYLEELSNPIPRSLWPDKPTIGLDYAIARGQKLDNTTEVGNETGATISTGMIGQGVVNFGRILGPLAAALLMSLWVAILARQDLLAAETGRLFLYAIGLILTFNMGRDITLLVIYPFCFGYLLLLITKSWHMVVNVQAGPPRKVGAVRPAARIK